MGAWEAGVAASSDLTLPTKIGLVGFEPTASTSRTWRSSQAEPQPVNFDWEHGDYISVTGKSTGENKSEVRCKKAEVIERKAAPLARQHSNAYFCLLTSLK
jgi:hypothetical protein